jgi:hypothetical protein
MSEPPDEFLSLSDNCLLKERCCPLAACAIQPFQIDVLFLTGNLRRVPFMPGLPSRNAISAAAMIKSFH